jgi:hypothetical protein
MSSCPTDPRLHASAKNLQGGFFIYQNRSCRIIPLYCIEDLSLSNIGQYKLYRSLVRFFLWHYRQVSSLQMVPKTTRLLICRSYKATKSEIYLAVMSSLIPY